MAEQIPYGIAESLIEKLASSVFAEIGRIYGVKDDLAKLKETIESIKDRLLDAEEKQEQDEGHAVKNWISRLKKVLHDADDLFDNFMAEDFRDKVCSHGKLEGKVRKFFSSSNPVVFRFKMAGQIEAIQKKINHIENDMSKLNFRQEERAVTENVSEWRETSSFVEESEIIGREESKRDIINLLMQTSSNQNVSLIAIVGVGGLGKTALAQLVYNDAQVQKFFSKHMWVCVSEDFDVKTLLKKILKSFDKNIANDLALDDLQKELRQSLSGQRYLLVLDDVWNKNYENWNHLRRYLTCGASGSKILVTTRLKEVAETMSVVTPYFLGGLSRNRSLTLFKKIAFGENAKTIDPNLLSIGEQIVDKCGGIPLAIRAIGSVLRTKNGEKEWLSILHGDIWRSSEDTERVMAVLKLSYKHLPIVLRQCFAYCCLYPKDWVIEKEELVQLWMAQGYLECSTETKFMEDVGNDYVKILLMRSFFQDVTMDQYGDIRCFKMHDLMHDLAMLVSGAECYLHGEGRRTIGTATHLSLSEALSVPFDSVDANRVRTILWTSNWQSSFIYLLDISIICKSLRVLKLCNVYFRELPKSICGLKHLRYLDLSNCVDLQRFPKCISNLVHLHTLKLCRFTRFEFSSSITKLISLRHLECKEGFYQLYMPTGMGKLTSLQTLEYFQVRENPEFAKLNELKDLNNLRSRLRISNLGLIKHAGLESKDVNLKEKKYLQLLELDWLGDKKNDDSLILLENLHPPQNLKELILNYYPGIRYPNWFGSLMNIVTISLTACHHLPRLDHLPLLKHLEIIYISDVWYEYTSYFSSSSMAKPITTPFFPSLETLRLFKCRQKEHVFLPPFPSLSSLSVELCRVNYMPTFPHVKDLRLWGCTIKPLIDTLNMNKEANPNPYLITYDVLHSSSFTPLSTLKLLMISEMDPLSINLLPEDWMQNLISLEDLAIELDAHMFRSLHHLPAALKTLSIEFFDKDDLYEAYKIEEVKIQGQPLHCLCSLQQIKVKLCSYMRELPEWIWNNPSLGEMTITSCSDLKLLPEGMNGLTNLQTLHILGANSELYERCQRQSGADWPKIAHIPYIEVKKGSIYD